MAKSFSRAGRIGEELATFGKADHIVSHVSIRAESSFQGIRLQEYFRQLETYCKAGVRELQTGKFRFYGELKLARTQGEMAGARLVREWSPINGISRTWYETLDHAGRIIVESAQNCSVLPARKPCD